MLWIIPAVHTEWYNPGTDNIVITNSVKWSVFNPWQAQSMDATTKNLKTNNNNTTKYLTIENVKKTTEEVEVVQGPMSKEPDTVLLDTPAKEPVKSPTRVTRAMARADHDTQQQVYKEFNDATGQTFKVTGDTTAVPIDMPGTDSELDGNSGSDIDDTEISYIWTDDIAAMTKTDGIADDDDLLDFYVMHACIQSDPGEPNSWKDALSGTEREWWMDESYSIGIQQFSEQRRLEICTTNGSVRKWTETSTYETSIQEER